MLNEKRRSVTPEEKFQGRFADWCSTKNKSFSSENATRTYQRRTQRYYDIVRLQQPDRVPVLLSAGGFVARYAGASYGDFFYDYEKAAGSYQKFYNDFDVDYQVAGSFLPGRVLDRLEYKLYSWPGGSLPEDRPFQFNEKEYMEEAAYDDLIADPEAFMLRTFMPRIFGALKGLQMLPLFIGVTELPFLPGMVAPFGAPPVRSALTALMKAGHEVTEWRNVIGRISAGIQSERGLPAIAGGMSKAPFDFIGDSLRGTRGIMLDMYRRPEKVLEACERLVPIAVKMAVLGANTSGKPVVGLPLHKGADGFMSNKNFEKFYWPTLKAVLLGIIEEGIVPSLFVEGAYNQRLDIIADAGLPKGKTVWYFDQTDLAMVKKKFGTWACIGGNVPVSLFKAATPKKIEEEVKRLIDIAAPGGGYYIAPGASLDDADPANVRAFLETARTYGVY